MTRPDRVDHSVDHLEWPLLDRMLAGECSAEERAAVDRWAAASPEHSEALDRVRESLRAAAAPPMPLTAERWTAIAMAVRADAPLGSEARREHAASPRRVARRWAYAAAGVVACLAVFVGVFRTSPWRAGSSTPRIIASLDVSATRAQHVRAQLPDGSTVVLAPETRVWYTQDASGARVVTLDGEAYFTVTHDPAKTFTVRAGNTSTQVLGTAFGVRAYRTDNAVRVSVVSGKVASSNARDRLVLTPGTVAQLTDSSATEISSAGQQKAAELTAWTQGRLVFDDTPVPEMLATVGRWYGYDFRLTDSTLASRHVSVWLSIEEPEEAMKILKGVLGVEMTFKGKVVLLHSTRGAKRSGPAPARRPQRDTFSLSMTEVGK